MKQPFGFSLIEMIVVVAIIGTIVAVTPSLLVWMHHQGAALAVDQFRSDLQLARIMAVKHRQRCAIAINTPQPEQYLNTLSGHAGLLSQFKGGVHFLPIGPDKQQSASRIEFNRKGMSVSVIPQNIFIANTDGSAIFRIRVMLPGGISIHRWVNGKWH
jgi:prepilin-type N-terminal cleavage/methylation domain-containing protein